MHCRLFSAKLKSNNRNIPRRNSHVRPLCQAAASLAQSIVWLWSSNLGSIISDQEKHQKKKKKTKSTGIEDRQTILNERCWGYLSRETNRVTKGTMFSDPIVDGYTSEV